MRAGGSVNAGTPVKTRLGYKRGVQRLPLAFAALEVPVIAAVNGAAIGAGCDLTCMCDLRVAGESARFAESFVKLGLIAGDGGSWLLPRVVGWSKAAEMALPGDMINAGEALAPMTSADRWLPTALPGAMTTLVGGASPVRYLPAAAVAVVTTGAALAAAIAITGRREI